MSSQRKKVLKCKMSSTYPHLFPSIPLIIFYIMSHSIFADKWFSWHQFTTNASFSEFKGTSTTATARFYWQSGEWMWWIIIIISKCCHVCVWEVKKLELHPSYTPTYFNIKIVMDLNHLEVIKVQLKDFFMWCLSKNVG